jgi:formylglycine-generating enzyme required for sulfatase activity
MFGRIHGLVVTLALLAAVPLAIRADEVVTIKGALQCNGMCVLHNEPKDADHVIVIVALDGSPSIAAKVTRVMDAFYPENGLDADAALKLNDAFDKNLKYFIAPDSPAPMPDAIPKTGVPGHYCHCAAPFAVTGTVYEADGKQWIKVTKYGALNDANVGYPAKMLAADRPFAMPDQKPLVLKINDTLSLNCIVIPPGKFVMDEQEYVASRYIEQVPHVVELTGHVAISEIPITQEIWQAVMGSNPSQQKGSQLPIEFPTKNPNFDYHADLATFLQKLTTTAGHTVRLPTGAEWEYIARAGTSNPGLPQKYRDQGLFKEDGQRVPLPVKSKKPNAWGFYDLFTPWWQLTADASGYPPRTPEKDPLHPVGPKGNHMLLGVAGDNWTITEREFEEFNDYTSKTFRVAVVLDDGPTR